MSSQAHAKSRDCTDIVQASELARLDAQTRLERDALPVERNRQGQFATPPILALDMMAYAKTLMSARPEGGVRFFDPAFGTGSFYAALLKEFGLKGVTSAAGYEVDSLYGQEAERLWGPLGLKLTVDDFTRALPTCADQERPNLLVCNPPYVRHHHLSKEEKERLRTASESASGIRLNGYAGLYCHFMLLSHQWMAQGGVAGWLVPSEFMDVGYGRKVKEYLLERTTLLRVHRFRPEDAQFTDALVSSAIVWFRNEPPPAFHKVEFTLGGKLDQPEVSATLPSHVLHRSDKWTKFPLAAATAHAPVAERVTRLKDLFEIKRGLATGANEFFIMSPEKAEDLRLPKSFLQPILPSPRYLETDEVHADEAGMPLIEKTRLLLSSSLPEDEIRMDHPDLWRYLQEGRENGVHERYLCTHRSLWYLQETRSPAPLLCTYMGRKDAAEDNCPFRFILNRSQATAPNVYLMLYPRPVLQEALDARPELIEEIWAALNALNPAKLSEEGRVYGGGLHKLEPKELGNVPATVISDLLPNLGTPSLF